jgi:hypothetical protein
MLSLKTSTLAAGTHPASCSALSLGIKWTGYKIDRSLLCSAEGKNDRSYTSTSPTRIHVMDRSNFTALQIILLCVFHVYFWTQSEFASIRICIFLVFSMFQLNIL